MSVRKHDLAAHVKRGVACVVQVAIVTVSGYVVFCSLMPEAALLLAQTSGVTADDTVLVEFILVMLPALLVGACAVYGMIRFWKWTWSRLRGLATRQVVERTDDE